jgi:hypothetical protein
MSTKRFTLSELVPEWLLTGSVTQLVLAIISKDTRTPLERWVFDVKLVESPADSSQPYALYWILVIRFSWSPQSTYETGGGDPGRDTCHTEADHLDGDVSSRDSRSNGIQHLGVHVGIG